MRFKAVALSISLGVLSAAAAGQVNQVTTSTAVPASPTIGTTKSVTASAAPIASSGHGATANAPASAGIVTLSDMARQSAEPARSPATPAAAAAAAVDVPAITSVDGSGTPIDAARERLRGGIVISPVIERPTNITLKRISRSGTEVTAILWVKGQSRKVTSGSRVLDYTVGEIKEDGVCLYTLKGKVKDKCRTMLTFIQGV